MTFLSKRKTKYFLLIGLILVVFIFALYEPPYEGLIEKSDQVLLFAHRGYGNYAPDNSLEGAKMAVALGLDGVDMDAQFSKDKQVVIFHDVSVERFTTGEGRVDSKTLAELQMYDLAEKFDQRGFSDIRIKTFDNFVEEIIPESLLMVELKVSAVKNTGIEEKVSEIIAKHNAYDEVYISSFNPVVLYRLKKIDPQIQTVFTFTDDNWDPERVAETKEEDRVGLPWFLRTEFTRKIIRNIIKPDALSVNLNVDEKVIDKLTSKGYPVFLWPVNSQEEINWALSKKPYGLVSDEPELIKKITDNLKN